MARQARFFSVKLHNLDKSWTVVVPSTSTEHVRSEMNYQDVRIDEVTFIDWFFVDVFHDGNGPVFSAKIDGYLYHYESGDDGYQHLRSQFMSQFNKVVEDNYYE